MAGVTGPVYLPRWLPDGRIAYIESTSSDGSTSELRYVAAPPPPPPPPFVTAVGTGLDSRQPFTFTGMNIYNTNSDGWCANHMDGGVLETALSNIGLGGLHGGDHGVIQDMVLPAPRYAQYSGARDWTRFNRTLAAARAAGYHVIPTLGNQWGECGHKGATAGYKTPQWYEAGYTQLAPEDSVYATYLSYRDWVAKMVARYKDNPTIHRFAASERSRDEPVWPTPVHPSRSNSRRSATWRLTFPE